MSTQLSCAASVFLGRYLAVWLLVSPLSTARGFDHGEERGYVRDIKQAGDNLITIINDILDFSKIEAGKLEIIPVKYMFSSLINDTVSIIRMRLIEKPIRFYTNIDSCIPNNLISGEPGH